MNKAVIYTSLTGGYDNLPQYEVIDPKFDYICFSNDFPDGVKIGQWKIRHIPYSTNNNQRLSRFVKIKPHEVLNEYEYSVWLDSNIIIRHKSIYEIIKKKIFEGDKWDGIKHPLRDCIYEEAQICIKLGRSDYSTTKKQLQLYKKNGFPHHFGLFENNMILRKHNDDLIRKINNEWWDLFEIYTQRDQLSLFYIFWKNNFFPETIFSIEENTRNIEGLRYLDHPFKFRNSIKTKIRVIMNSILNTLHC